jgi:hypothetical protein
LYYGRGSTAFDGYSADSSSFFDDPRFVDVTSFDFTLSGNSPAIDKGVLIHPGQQYSGSYPDIGAFESTSSPPPSVTPTPTSSPTPTPTPSPTPSPTPTGEVVTLSPIADTYVDSASEGSNYGSASQLSIDGSPSYKISYLKFDLGSLTGQNILSAVLRLKVFSEPYSDSTSTQYVKVVSDTSWGESVITYNNRPSSSTTLGNINAGSGSLGQWQEIDVTSFIHSNRGQTISIGIDAPSSSSDGVDFYSRETSSSSPQLVVTKSGSGTLTTPTGVQASDGTYTSRVELTWDASWVAKKYEVYRSNSKTGMRALLKTVYKPTYYDLTASPGINYYYWVKACFYSKCSGFSDYDFGWRKLSGPTNLSASDGKNKYKVIVSWDESPGANTYNVFRSASLTGPKRLLGATVNNVYHDKDAAPGKKYFYWVKACYNGRCSALNKYDAGWRKISRPTNVKASEGKYLFKVEITWDAPHPVNKFKVFRASSLTGPRKLIGIASNNVFYDKKTLRGKKYIYWVKACNFGRCSFLSSYSRGWRR